MIIKKPFSSFILAVIFFTALSTPNADAGMDEGLNALKQEDYKKALSEFKPLALKGYPKAQRELGLMYRRGLGVAKDKVEAVKWIRKAAEQGNAWAQADLANMFTGGEGVPQNYAEAAKWMREAAEQGNRDAQVAIADMYFEGKGVPENNVESYKWSILAAAQGSGEARIYMDILTKSMTQEQIAKAQGEAKIWNEKHNH